MNNVFSKPLNNIEFGKLLMECNYISKIPTHLYNEQRWKALILYNSQDDGY